MPTASALILRFTRERRARRSWSSSVTASPGTRTGRFSSPWPRGWRTPGFRRCASRGPATALPRAASRTARFPKRSRTSARCSMRSMATPSPTPVTAWAARSECCARAPTGASVAWSRSPEWCTWLPSRSIISGHSRRDATSCGASRAACFRRPIWTICAGSDRSSIARRTSPCLGCSSTGRPTRSCRCKIRARPSCGRAGPSNSSSSPAATTSGNRASPRG